MNPLRRHRRASTHESTHIIVSVDNDECSLSANISTKLSKSKFLTKIGLVAMSIKFDSRPSLIEVLIWVLTSLSVEKNRSTDAVEIGIVRTILIIVVKQGNDTGVRLSVSNRSYTVLYFLTLATPALTVTISGQPITRTWRVAASCGSNLTNLT